MAATKENPIILYDIPDSNNSSWSFNPYKTRLSLDYKGIPYRVEYLAFPDIEPKLKELGLPQVSETIPRYTLPVIADPSSDPNGKPTYVSDSFKIAIYLDEKYPSPQYPAIFPSGTHAIQSLLVSQYLTTLAGPLTSLFAGDMARILDARSIEYLRNVRGFALEPKPLPEDEAEIKWRQAREKFGSIDKALDWNGTGPFLFGSQPSFVDFALGGFFHFVERVQTAGPDQLERILEWQDGRWDGYWKAIKQIENNTSQVF